MTTNAIYKTMIKFTTFCIFLLFSLYTTAQSTALTSKNKDGFTTIFNGENYDGWYVKIKSGDEELAKKVFAIEDGMIHVFNKNFPQEYNLNTGADDTHGLIYSKKKYSKYILRFDYKWGTRIANNFGRWQYDAGVYYHVTNDAVWPVGIEYQIRYDHLKNSNHTGDLIRPKGADYDWYSNEKGDSFLSPFEGGIPEKTRTWMHLVKPNTAYNGLNDTWNQCEIIVMGDKYSIHKLNGEIVNMAFNLKPSAGIFGFQSETAEIYYRNIEIKEFDEIVPIENFIK